MNKDFHQNKFSIQALCNILRPVLGMELMVVDKSLIAIAGTGPYEKNVGSRRPRESYVDITLKSGEGFQISAPGETEQCLKCELKSQCTYTSVISCPLRYQDQTVGLFGFLGYDGDQRQTMQNKALFLSNLAEDIGEYIVNNFFDQDIFYYDFVSSNAMNSIVNAIDKGIIITDCKNKIVNVNQFAEKELKFKQNDCLGKGINVLNADVEILGSVSKFKKAKSTGKSKFFAIASPILYNDQRVGNVFRLQKETKRRSSSRVYSFNKAPAGPIMVGMSEPILELKRIATKVAGNNSKILITGETGTGKELIAELIHAKSQRRFGPFVVLNCGAIPETLMESELFGYEKGTFTGARKSGKIGKFELADKGTIFLDEIGNLSLTGQAKILRILDNHILEKLGSEAPKKLDVRLISATNKNLPRMVEEGLFLKDLYYRLNVVQLETPPLRERKTDIPLLLDFFIKENNQRLDSTLRGFNRAAMIYLIHFQWPGNVRELINVTEYACNVKSSGFAGLEDLPPYMSSQVREILDKPGQRIVDTERLMVEQAIRLYGNSTKSKQKAARYLGISISTLYRRLNMISSKKISAEKNC
jgi:sigma-54 dependent transcriptional regulator, acetoin dehydrogenase operon transcriptional activator AcoR